LSKNLYFSDNDIPQAMQLALGRIAQEYNTRKKNGQPVLQLAVLIFLNNSNRGWILRLKIKLFNLTSIPT